MSKFTVKTVSFLQQVEALVNAVLSIPGPELKSYIVFVGGLLVTFGYLNTTKATSIEDVVFGVVSGLFAIALVIEKYFQGRAVVAYAVAEAAKETPVIK